MVGLKAFSGELAHQQKAGRRNIRDASLTLTERVLKVLVNIRNLKLLIKTQNFCCVIEKKLLLLHAEQSTNSKRSL